MSKSATNVTTVEAMRARELKRAAAEELYEALHRMIRAFEPRSKPVGAPGSMARSYYDESVEAHAQARAALAKARGEEAS